MFIFNWLLKKSIKFLVFLFFCSAIIQFIWIGAIDLSQITKDIISIIEFIVGLIASLLQM